MDRVGDIAEENLILSEQRAEVIKDLDPLASLIALLLLQGTTVHELASMLNEPQENLRSLVRKKKP